MTTEILIAVILILPGFLSLYIIRKVSIQEEKLSGEEYYLWSLLLSVIIFAVFSYIVNIRSLTEIEDLIFDSKKIILLYFLATVFGIIPGKILKKVIHEDYRVLPGEVWSITLMRLNREEGKFVTVFTTDNLEFSGRVRIYSTREDSPREILIEDPIQIIRNEKMEEISTTEWGKEILFTESDIRRIVFYETTREA